MKLTITAPDPRGGQRLAASIESATGHPTTVVLVGDQWEIDTDAAEVDVRAVVDAHDGTPEPVIDVHAAIQADPSLAQATKDALCTRLCPEA